MEESGRKSNFFQALLSILFCRRSSWRGKSLGFVERCSGSARCRLGPCVEMKLYRLSGFRCFILHRGKCSCEMQVLQSIEEGAV